MIAMNKNETKIIGLSALGGMLELYDFAIYGTFSIYFAHQFFPSDNPYTVILQTYMVFLLGFILRPIGGLLFSHIGDEYGRKKVFIATIFIMGISSLGIACLPTYNHVGLIAPVLLLVCRLLQGLALGGELPTTYVYISESLPNKRIIAFSITMAGIFSGYLLASLINYILIHTFNNIQLNVFAWRIPFAIGGIICFISYQVRKSLHETPEFKNILNKPKLPIIYLLKNHWVQVLIGMIFSGSQQVFSVVAIIYMPTYLKTMVHLPSAEIGNLLPLALITTITTIVISGYWFSKYKNLNNLILWVLIINTLTIPLFYYLIAMQISVLVGYLLLMIVHGLVGLLVPLYITTLFPSNIRLSGVALCYNLSIISFAGFAPIIITELISKCNLLVTGPSIYIVIFMIAAALCIPWLKRQTN